MRQITKKEAKDYQEKIDKIDSQIHELKLIRKGYKSILTKGVCYDLSDLIDASLGRVRTRKK